MGLLPFYPAVLVNSKLDIMLPWESVSWSLPSADDDNARQIMKIFKVLWTPSFSRLGFVFCLSWKSTTYAIERDIIKLPALSRARKKDKFLVPDGSRGT